MSGVHGEDIDRYVTDETRPGFLSRFSVKFEVRDSGCWEWTAGRDKFGYGMFFIGRHFKKRTVFAHRMSHLLFKGPIGRLCVLHKCDNERCVNPEHLYLGTQADNLRDQKDRRRRAAPVGELNPYAKLTTNDVIEIRASNESNQSIAKRYNINPTTVWAIKARTKWRHVP